MLRLGLKLESGPTPFDLRTSLRPPALVYKVDLNRLRPPLFYHTMDALIGFVKKKYRAGYPNNGFEPDITSFCVKHS